MVRVGVIGAGFMGTMHATVYAQFPDVRVAGIADTRAEKARSLAEKLKTAPFYSAEELLKREDITIIDVCLPSYLHREFVVKAAELGKDVICEKPIALSLEDADEMIRVCQERRVRFLVAHVIRFWPEYRFLKEVYDREKYGKLLAVSCSRLSPAPTWGWQNWLMKEDLSGGAIIDLHIHDTDYILHLIGKKPSRVYTRAVRGSSGLGHLYSVYVFENGPLVFAEGGWEYPAGLPFRMGFVAQFEKATVEFDSRNSPTLSVYEASGKIDRPTFEVKKAEGVEGNISDLGGYYYELRYFIEHVVHNKPFGVVTPEQARDSLEIVLKEKESAEKCQELCV